VINLEKFKKWIGNQLSASPIATGWFVFFVSLFFTMYLSYAEYQLKLSVEREEVNSKLNDLEHKFTSAITNGVSAVKTLGFYAQHQENVVANFPTIGKEILASNPLVDIIQYLEDGTIVAVYPTEGNESVIGYNVLEDSIRDVEVLEAVRRKDVFFSGPIYLQQGGVGIVGRYPIFKNDELRGLSASVIMIETIFENELSEGGFEDKLLVKLTKENANSREIENYIPSNDHTKASGLAASSRIDIGNWTLTVQQKKSTALSSGLFAIFFRIFLSVSLGYISWHFARQPVLLRKKVEEQSKEILEANERFQLATKATSDVIWDWDIGTDKIYRSELFFKLLGYEDSDQIDTNDFFRTIIHQEDLKKVTQNLDETLQSMGLFWEQEFRVIKADGSYAYINDKGYILRDEAGKAIRMIGATQDITKRKKVENELVEANKSLANANKELKAFAFLASHDMREPLRMISSFMSLLQKKYSSGLDEKANRYITFAIDGAKRLTLLINDLLEYSKVGFEPTAIEKIDSNAMIQEVLAFKSDIIRESNAQIIVENLPQIVGIKTPIQTLFQNLIGNALKYKKNDSTPIIKISGKQKKDFVEFSIEDNGIGIEADYLEHIFGILNRLHPKELYPGTGMGLATCKKIVTQHGGEIWAESNFGTGSKFLFTLKTYE
jgi:PAS domain S-box-containing protein